MCNVDLNWGWHPSPRGSCLPRMEIQYYVQAALTSNWKILMQCNSALTWSQPGAHSRGRKRIWLFEAWKFRLVISCKGPVHHRMFTMKICIHIYIYIYIYRAVRVYIYICVCICVCMCSEPVVNRLTASFCLSKRFLKRKYSMHDIIRSNAFRCNLMLGWQATLVLPHWAPSFVCFQHKLWP